MLLHVLGKVGFLGVALATVGTDVCLYMLGLLVLGDVLEQRLLVREAFVAGVALVGLVSLVAPGVGLQVGQLREGLGATRNSALVRFVPCVGPDVLLKVGELGELALADLAPVGLDAQVDSRVLGEVGAVRKSLVARCALVRFWFSHVNLSVKL